MRSVIDTYAMEEASAYDYIVKAEDRYLMAYDLTYVPIAGRPAVFEGYLFRDRIGRHTIYSRSGKMVMPYRV